MRENRTYGLMRRRWKRAGYPVTRQCFTLFVDKEKRIMDLYFDVPKINQEEVILSFPDIFPWGSSESSTEYDGKGTGRSEAAFLRDPFQCQVTLLQERFSFR